MWPQGVVGCGRSRHLLPMLPRSVRSLSDDSDGTAPLKRRQPPPARKATRDLEKEHRRQGTGTVKRRRVAQAEGRQVTKLSDDEEVGPTAAALAVPLRMPPPPRGCALGALGGSAPVPLRGFIEVFSGSANLSDVWRCSGHPVFPMDIAESEDYDMHSDAGLTALEQAVRRLDKQTSLSTYVHFAPPCSAYSQARWPHLRRANRITRNTFAAMRKLSDSGHPVSVEQPSGSVMWKTRDFKCWAARSGAAPVTTDYCQYGADYRKRTVLWVSPAGMLDDIARKCPGVSDSHKHPRMLSHWGADRSTRTRTGDSNCAAYPPALCRAWCEAAMRSWSDTAGQRPK